MRMGYLRVLTSRFLLAGSAFALGLLVLSACSHHSDVHGEATADGESTQAESELQGGDSSWITRRNTRM